MLSLVLIFVLFSKATSVTGASLITEKLCEKTRSEPIEAVINDVIDEISNRSECMVFVFDAYYRRLIHHNRIRKSKLMPIYSIEIRENEIFLPPKNRVEMILEQSKRAACDAYVILVANGLQVTQFLQYAENERKINTHGLFLLIHDWRLFGSSMRHVWNRIINVVFIRRFNFAKRRSGERVSREWFNLETVYYPARVKNFVITRYLDTWYRGKYRYGENHFTSKIDNLRKTVMKIAVFEHVPAVTKAAGRSFKRFPTGRKDGGDDENEFGKARGIEFELVQIIARKMNFVASFYEPYGVDVSRWGSPRENDTFDGLLGEAVAGKAAFLIGDLHYTLRHNRLLDLSLPYNTECLTFLTPEALTDNSWKLLIVPFRLYTWIAVILTLFLGACIFHLFARTYEKYISPHTQNKQVEVTCHVIRKFRSTVSKSLSKKKEKSFESLDLFTQPGNSILYTYSMLLQVSLPRIPAAWAVRVFIGWWWLYGILVTVAYRASMTATLANPIGRMTIDTIADLAKSRIGAGGWNDEQRDLFLSSSDKDVQKIGEKFELTGNEEEAIARVANGSFSYYENIYVLKQARAIRQKLEYTQMKNALKEDHKVQADRDLHIMGECLIDMPVSIGMDKNSPLKPHVDRMIRQVVEAGFVAKWLSDVTEWSKIVELRYKSPPEQTLVNLHKLHGALVALGIGYFLSFVALATEIFHWKYVIMRNPAYDKYQMDVFYSNRKKL
ncbi:ionotropic receptor 21a [Venturia canescens]|uniref:ionotropic receptor 21a n=1 Tax=Venturia canescens TaxID=32260 RepID=UPI001C9BC1AA|nr:ionotropic receptor 21a [Venturia canescens]